MNNNNDLYELNECKKYKRKEKKKNFFLCETLNIC